MRQKTIKIATLSLNKLNHVGKLPTLCMPITYLMYANYLPYVGKLPTLCMPITYFM